MASRIHRLSAFSAAAMLLLPALAWSQDRSDRVEYWVRGKEGAKTAVRSGLILEETPAKVVVRLAGGERLEIPSEDVVEVEYDGAPTAVLMGKGAEKNRQYDAALQHYEKALKELKPSQRPLETQIRFRLADLLYVQAQSGGAAERQKAAAALTQFLKEHPAARQTLPALERLGRLRIQDSQSAAEALAALKAAQLSGKDPAYSVRCDLLALKLILAEADALRKTQPEAAKERAVIALAAADKLRGEAEGVVLAEAKRCRSYALAGVGRGAEALAEIDGLLHAAEDENAQARILFERGELKRLMGRPDQARWDFLRLELLAPGDKELQAKVLDRLAQTFDELGDSGRARDYRERLRRSPP